jgi:hypothetical protein
MVREACSMDTAVTLTIPISLITTAPWPLNAQHSPGTTQACNIQKETCSLHWVSFYSFALVCEDMKWIHHLVFLSSSCKNILLLVEQLGMLHLSSS